MVLQNVRERFANLPPRFGLNFCARQPPHHHLGSNFYGAQRTTKARVGENFAPEKCEGPRNDGSARFTNNGGIKWCGEKLMTVKRIVRRAVLSVVALVCGFAMLACRAGRLTEPRPEAGGVLVANHGPFVVRSYLGTCLTYGQLVVTPTPSGAGETPVPRRLPRALCSSLSANLARLSRLDRPRVCSGSSSRRSTSATR